MTRHHRKNEGEPPVATPEASPTAAPAPVTPERAPEQTGLTGVDVECLPPATREELESLRRERDELKDMALVAASCAVQGEASWGLGVLGSTRMEYARVMALVDHVARTLARTLQESRA